jgi:hypothetical protein
MRVAVVGESLPDVVAAVEGPQTRPADLHAALLLEGVGPRAETKAGLFLQALLAREIFLDLGGKLLARRCIIETPAEDYFVPSLAEALQDCGDGGFVVPQSFADFGDALLDLREICEGAVAEEDDPPVVLLSVHITPHQPDPEDWRGSF